MLVLGQGGGHLALLAASAGAGTVTVVEQGMTAYHMTSAVLNANRCLMPEVVGRVHLVAAPLRQCRGRLATDVSTSPQVGPA